MVRDINSGKQAHSGALRPRRRPIARTNIISRIVLPGGPSGLQDRASQAAIRPLRLTPTLIAVPDGVKAQQNGNVVASIRRSMKFSVSRELPINQVMAVGSVLVPRTRQSRSVPYRLTCLAPTMYSPRACSTRGLGWLGCVAKRACPEDCGMFP